MIKRLFLPQPAKLQADARRSFEEMMKDQGRFVYDENGFIYPFADGTAKIKWTSIERLEGYKRDFLTMDMICMDITFDGSVVTFSEETPGWYIFQEKLRAALPEVSKNWEFDISFPALATNFTVLYERKDGNLLEGKNEIA
jgi:hypothetical protein